jgi:signal transduction histidine kinase
MLTPQPRLSDVTALIEGMRRGSLEIHPSESGRPVELSSGQQVAVFRIVQECLTNALKHGGRGTDVRLHFDWSGPGLTLHVASVMASVKDAGADEPVPVRAGRGLPGMRERAHIAGGWLTAGPDGEHFRVTAFIPYGMPEPRTANDTASAVAGGTFSEFSIAETQPVLSAVARQGQTSTTGELGNRG